MKNSRNISRNIFKPIDGELNPADDASRGLLAHNQREDKWPKRPIALGEIPSDDAEVKRETITCASSAATLSIDWMLRYKRNLREAFNRRKKGERDHPKPSTLEPVTDVEMKIAQIRVKMC